MRRKATSAAAAAAVAWAGASSASAPANDEAVWKFGYGSNMSQDFLRTKKALSPLDSRRTVLKGFQLSFPAGRGIDYVEPTFATLKRDPAGEVHGVSTLLSRADADKLDRQEGGYAIEVAPARIYDSEETMDVEVYVPQKPLPLDYPEGACSTRYRDILIRGAVENCLEASWIAKLRALATYTPAAETLARREAVPSPSALPAVSIDELRQHKGETGACWTACGGYVFEHTPIFSSYRGRDITRRNLLHFRGINLDANDDGGVSPFPRLSELSAAELEYVLQNRDRLLAKSGTPIAVLRPFWEEQDREVPGVYSGNTLSKV